MRQRKTFTAEEDAFILSNPQLSGAALGRTLGRGHQSCTQRRKLLLSRQKNEEQVELKAEDIVSSYSEHKPDVTMLKEFTPRQLMDELFRRGYKGELQYEYREIRTAVLGR